MRQDEHSSIRDPGDRGVLDRRLYERDVAPSVGGHTLARLAQHLGTQVNANQAPIRPDLILKQRERESRTACNIDHRLTGAQLQASDGPPAQATSQWGEAVVAARATPVRLKRELAVGSGHATPRCSCTGSA